MTHLLILQQIVATSAQLSSDAGRPHALLADVREQQIAGMLELAALLELPPDLIDALEAHRWALIDTASTARWG